MTIKDAKGRLTENGKALIYEMRNDGATYRQIAGVVGVSVMTVGYNLSSTYKETIKKHSITQRRRTTLNTTGGIVRGLHKREFPANNLCELCNKNTRRLEYHHWNNRNLNLGVWICNRCHKIAESLDDPGFPYIMHVYSCLKEAVSIEPLPNYSKECYTGREYMRRHVISRGKDIAIKELNKRRYPTDNTCETCNREARFLAYHHWDNSNPNLGLWLCVKCHSAAELVDNQNLQAIVGRYFRLKQETIEIMGGVLT